MQTNVNLKVLRIIYFLAEYCSLYAEIQRVAVSGCLVYSRWCHGHLTPEQTLANSSLIIPFFSLFSV